MNLRKSALFIKPTNEQKQKTARRTDSHTGRNFAIKNDSPLAISYFALCRLKVLVDGRQWTVGGRLYFDTCYHSGIEPLRKETDYVY